jgi:hypothetical protein
VGVDDPENWTGIYFQGVPIVVTAVPADGYQFSHWKGLDESSEDQFSPQITINPYSDVLLRAVFVGD